MLERLNRSSTKKPGPATRGCCSRPMSLFMWIESLPTLDGSIEFHESPLLSSLLNLHDGRGRSRPLPAPFPRRYGRRGAGACAQAHTFPAQSETINFHLFDWWSFPSRHLRSQAEIASPAWQTDSGLWLAAR